MAAAGAGGIGATLGIGGVSQMLAGLRQVGAGFGAAGGAATGMAASLNTASAGFAAFNTGVAALGKSVEVVGDAFSTATAPVRALGGAIIDIGKEAGGAAVTALKDIAEAALAVGVAGGVGVTALAGALGAGIGASIAAAAEFEKQLTDLRAIAQATPQELRAIDEAARGLAPAFGIGASSIVSAGRELVKAGVALDTVTGGALQGTLALSKLSGGELDAAKAAEVLGANLTAFGPAIRASGDDAVTASFKILNSIQGIANATRAAPSEVATGLAKAAPTLTAFGLSIEEVNASLGILLSRGIRGEEAGTAIRNFFLRITNPSQEAKKALDFLGVRISAFEKDTGKLRPAADIFKDMAEQLKRLPDDETRLGLIGEVFQTRSLTTALAIMDAFTNTTEGAEDQFASFLRTIAETNILDQSKIQMDTLTRQVERLGAALEVGAIGFGRKFVPDLQRFATGAADFLEKNADKIGGALGGGARSLLTGEGAAESFDAIFDSLGEGAATAFANVFNAVETVRQPVSDLLSALGTLKDTLLSVIFPDGPTAGIARFVDFLGEGIALGTRFTTFLSDNVAATAQSFGTLVGEAFSFLGGLKDIVNQDKGFAQVKEIADSLGPLFGTVRDEAGKLATSAANFVKVVVENRDAIVRTLQTVVTLFSGMAQGVIVVITKVVELIGKLDELKQNPTLAILQAAGLTRTQALAITQPPPAGSQGPTIGPPGLVQPGAPVPTGITLQRPSQLGDLVVPTVAEINSIELQEQALAALSEEERSSERQTDLLAHAYAGLATRQEQAAAAASAAAAAAGADAAAQARTLASMRDLEAERKAAEAAAKAQAAATERLTEAQEDHGKQVDTILRNEARAVAAVAERWQDAMESIAESTSDAAQKIEENAERQREKLQETFDIGQDVDARRRALRERLELERLDFGEHLQDLGRQRADAAEDAERLDQRADQREIRTEQERQDRISTIRQRAIDRDNRLRQRGNEDTLRIIQEGLNRQQESLSRSFDDQNRGRLRNREDQRRGEQRNRDLAKATTDEERKSIQERFREETRATSERRQDEDQDRGIRLSQESQLQNLRQSQETVLRDLRRNIEDQDVLHREQQEDALLLLRKSAELELEAFRIGIEDRQTARRRLAQQRELLEQRRIQREVERPREQEAESQQRDLDLTLALEANARARLEIDRDVERAQTELIQRALRQMSDADRAAARQYLAIGQQTRDQFSALAAKQVDARSDLIRGFRETGGAPPAFLEALDRANAVMEAQRIIAEGRSQAALDIARQNMGGLPGAEQIVPERVFVPLPATEAANQLTAVMRELIQRIDKVAPGIHVETVEQNFPQPVTPGDAITGLRTIGGAL